jgi:hypothetical protein
MLSIAYPTELIGYLYTTARTHIIFDLNQYVYQAQNVTTIKSCLLFRSSMQKMFSVGFDFFILDNSEVNNFLFKVA